MRSHLDAAFFPVQKWIMRSALKCYHISAPSEIQWPN
ncbi:hypothetical protein OROHE_002476 [Orobanche hederae]